MRIKPIAFILAALLPVLSYAEKSERLPLPSELQGKEIPSFFALAANNVDELYKSDIKEAAKREGAKRVVLSLFASWCEKCMEEFEILKRNREELKRQGVLIYLIDVGEDIHKLGGKVAEMVRKYAGDSFPCYFDPNAILPKTFGLAKQGGDLNLPMTLILDSDLRVLGILVGKMGDDFPKVLWSEL